MWFFTVVCDNDFGLGTVILKKNLVASVTFHHQSYLNVWVGHKNCSSVPALCQNPLATVFFICVGGWFLFSVSQGEGSKMGWWGGFQVRTGRRLCISHTRIPMFWFYVSRTFKLLLLHAFKFLLNIEEWHGFLPYVYYKLRLSMLQG